MPSIEESKRLVNQAIHTTQPNHHAILANLQDEIDKHNDVRRDAEREIKRHRKRRHHTDTERNSDLRFHFKHGVSDARHKRSRHSQRLKDEAKDIDDKDNADDDNQQEHHPFPREPISPNATPTTDDAFLSSLLDALADDEAAAYWESVYSQPIHTYQRPSVRTDNGQIEQMNDDEYAAWVKQKMWEKNHPEIMLERDRMKRKQQEEQELKSRRKEEFLRKRRKEAWDRASSSSKDYDYVFDFDSSNSTAKNVGHSRDELPREEWIEAWNEYLRAWEKLKSCSDEEDKAEPSKVLPWPVLPSKPATRPNIEAFMKNMPLADGKTKQHVLKAERVRWHPDKIQQRFGGNVDEGTMRVVTGIFQIVDNLWNESSSN